MSAVRISSEKTVLDDQLESGEQWLAWIEGAKKFQDVIRGGVDWQQLQKVDRKFVTERLGVRAPIQQVIINSLYLTMASSFEEYLRSSIRRIVERVSMSNSGYQTVSIEARKINFREVGKILARLDSLPEYLSVNVDELCGHVGSCASGSQKVTFSAQAISNVDGLIRLDAFIDRVSCFGVPISLDSIAADQGVKLALKLERAGAREVAKALSSELEIVSKYRNRIAHTGPTSSDVTPEIAASHRDLFRAISGYIDRMA